jgi:hypothetical protein
MRLLIALRRGQRCPHDTRGEQRDQEPTDLCWVPNFSWQIGLGICALYKLLQSRFDGGPRE